MKTLIVLGTFALFSTGCSDTCANEIVTEIASPARDFKAVMFRRDCGATTSYSTQVSILAEGAELSGTGNVYRADDDHGVAPVGKWDGPWAEIRWIGPRQLLVRYAAGSRIFEQSDDQSGISVSYEAVERIAPN